MQGRRSIFPAGVAPHRKRGAGALQFRFGALLVALAALATAPWAVSAMARHSVDGLARALDLTGSLRYRLRDIRRDVATDDATHVREQLAVQRSTLDELIAGDVRDGVPPCASPDICARLEEHRATLRFEITPDVEMTLARHAISTPDLAIAIREELDRLDQTVELTTELMQQRAVAISGLGTLAGSGSLALVLIVGFGVWDVFGRVRRLHSAVVARSEQGLRAEMAGEHELALLAQALADGLAASNAKREADERRLREIRAEQEALRFAAESLNEWIAGIGDLQPALDRVAEAAGVGALHFDETAKSTTVDAEFVGDGDLVVPLTWRDEHLGALRASGDEPSPEKFALIATLAQLLTLACLSRRVLTEREHRGEIASALASIGALRPGASRLGRLLRLLVAHDQAQLDLLDDAGKPQDRFLIGADHIERSTTPATVEVPAAVTIEGEKLKIPLAVGGVCVGVLRLCRDGEAFSRQEAETAGTLAPVLASALLRMRLMDRLRLSEQWTTIGAFGRMLADQLRNPLNNMKLQLQLVERRLRKLQRAAESEGLVDRVAVLTAEVERVDNLLSEYLGMHPASGDQHYDFVDLGAVVKDVLAEARELVEGESVTLVEDIVPGAVVTGSESRLRQTVMQLVKNSVEAMHGKADGRIAITLRERPAEWELTVRDNGPGIIDPVAIFAPGYTTKSTGTGMGLAMSLHTVLQHRGKLSARIPEDGGAELTLSLPKRVSAVAQASAVV